MGCFFSTENSLSGPGPGPGIVATHDHPSLSSLAPSQPSNSRRPRHLSLSSHPPPPTSTSLSIYSLLPSLLPFRESFQDLFLTETDVAQLYALYKLLKHPKEDCLDKKKFINYFDLQQSLFALRIVNQHKSLVSIFDMILLLWHFCTIGKHLGHLLLTSASPSHPHSLSSPLALYVHDLYTTKDSPLTVFLCDEMVKELFGRKYDKTSQAIKLNRKLQHLSTNGVIHSWFLLEFTTQHPFLLSPCVSLQKRVMDSSLGRSRWEKLTQSRIRGEHGQYKSLDQVLERLNLNPKAKQRHDRIRSRVCSELGMTPRVVNDASLSELSSSSDSLPQVSGASGPSNSSSLLQRWYRQIGSNLDLIDTRTVIVRPLPPVDAPTTIKALNTFSKSSGFTQHQRSGTGAGGLSEVKYLSNMKSPATAMITSPASYDHNNSLVIEDLE